MDSPFLAGLSEFLCCTQAPMRTLDVFNFPRVLAPSLF
jgi:hypothetical protein